MAEILSIDFNQLPRATRERFVAITQNKTGPAPIFQQRRGSGGAFGWFLLVALFGALSAGLVLVGFGDPYSATQPVATALAYVLFFYLCFFGVLGWVRASVRKKALPFSAGAYVFPADTVVAWDHRIKLMSAKEITGLQPVHHHRNGVYMFTAFELAYSDGTRLRFNVHGKAPAEAAMARLRAEGAQAAEAMARRDANQLYPLDPLFEARMSGFQPVDDPTGPRARPVPNWTKKAGLLALGAAAVLGPLVYGLRNLASDELAFVDSETSYQYQAYLRNGWRHLDEVQREHLPRAQLKEAAALVNVDERLVAIQAVMKNELVPTVRAEATKALKLALHAAFEQARAAGTVSALRTFMQQHPDAEDVPAAKQGIHDLFQKTLADFKPRASKPGSVPFVEALLAHMEKHDSPPLEVRFRRHNSPSLDVADQVLAKPKPGSAAPGELAAASKHFDPAAAASREGAVIDAMQKGFAGVFPTDVLPLIKGEDLDANDTSIPGTSKPSIFVDYTVGWSGATYSDAKEDRRFVGVRFDFDVLMTVPNSAKLLKLKLKVLPPDEFSVSYDTFSNPSFGAAIKARQGPAASLVYDVMALRAFDQLSSKIQDEFFVRQPAAAEAAAN